MWPQATIDRRGQDRHNNTDLFKSLLKEVEFFSLFQSISSNQNNQLINWESNNDLFVWFTFLLIHLTWINKNHMKLLIELYLFLSYASSNTFIWKIESHKKQNKEIEWYCPLTWSIKINHFYLSTFMLSCNLWFLNWRLLILFLYQIQR